MKAILNITDVRNAESWSDEDLLLHYRQTKDRELFAVLVRRYQRDLYAYLRRYLGNGEMAEDAFQATFLQVHLKCDQFEKGRRFRPWLYAVATNRAIDLRRRNQRHDALSLQGPASGRAEPQNRLVDLLESDRPGPLSLASDSESAEWVRSAMDILSEELRSAVHLVYFQGLRYAEAAETLGVPLGTVKSRIHAAVQQLVQHWNSTHLEPV